MPLAIHEYVRIVPVFYLQNVADHAVSHQRAKKIVPRLFKGDCAVVGIRGQRLPLLPRSIRSEGRLDRRTVGAHEEVAQGREPVRLLLNLVDALHIREALHDTCISPHAHDGVRSQIRPQVGRDFLLEPSPQLGHALHDKRLPANVLPGLYYERRELPTLDVPVRGLQSDILALDAPRSAEHVVQQDRSRGKLLLTRT
jgi:hypothetical protein